MAFNFDENPLRVSLLGLKLIVFIISEMIIIFLFGKATARIYLDKLLN